MDELEQRIIQGFVPGRQMTIVHVIASPERGVYTKPGLTKKTNEVIGILTITSGEATIIAADVASKSAGVNVEFINRFSRALLVTGDVSSVEESLQDVISTLESVLHFTPTTVAKS